ncbi:MAG: glycogen synthase GlgA [Wenzhouxiangella sp.]|nr:MAG: glycogen synthase GlgA [Wenzhouxiangella sp.]
MPAILSFENHGSAMLRQIDRSCTNPQFPFVVNFAYDPVTEGFANEIPGIHNPGRSRSPTFVGKPGGRGVRFPAGVYHRALQAEIQHVSYFQPDRLRTGIHDNPGPTSTAFQGQKSHLPAAELVMTTPALRVLLCASEIFPLAKTGGLADASAALAAALDGLGVKVHLLMPAYGPAIDQVVDLAPPVALPDIMGHSGGLLLSGKTPDTGIPITLIDYPQLYRDGGGLYLDADGHERPNNPQRFAVMAHAACRFALGEFENDRFDLVHCNDWHTGLLPLLLKTRAVDEYPASVFTIHNMAFQGLCPMDLLPELDLGLAPDQLGRVEYYGQASFLKAGLEFADELTAVSPRYADEIQTEEFGFGLEGVMQARSDHLTGILNGIDRSVWSPSVSPWIHAHFDQDHMQGKAACKLALQRELGLVENPNAPLMIFIGRLTWQKMADVLLEALPHYLALEPDRQFALLGTGEIALEEAFYRMASEHVGRVWVSHAYSEECAHRMHAGGDFLIHGSRFEPCGLTQLYAMQFGTIPIVRPVGGLADTVVDATPGTLAAGTATGIHFAGTGAEDMLAGINRTIALYRCPDAWRSLQRAAMQTDFSWDTSARAYLSVYLRALSARRLSD